MDAKITGQVQDRYAAGAGAQEESLCCPVDYDRRYLEVIPDEVIERDYGCGDPSRYVRAGETVLDLGSGGGKICFIAAQIVGSKGRVIGVDMTPDMLDLARRSTPVVADRIGYENVEFRRGYIQDLRLDPDLVDDYLKTHPVTDIASYQALQAKIDELKTGQPLIADNSVDVIVSNCVLNLVSDNEKHLLFREIYRVLKPGGRIAISDIVSDRHSPDHLKENAELWSGCISGALQEHDFMAALEAVGFYGITIDKLEAAPWQVVEDIEYRAMTVLAWKGQPAQCGDETCEVIYKGPWKTVTDDEGHTFERGQRTKICEKTFHIMGAEPYAASVFPVGQDTGMEVGATGPAKCC